MKKLPCITFGLTASYLHGLWTIAQSTRMVLLAFLLMSCWAAPVWAVDLNVYILTGQSNSLGTTFGEGATADLYGPGNDPADGNTQFFWSNVNAVNTVYPPLLYGDSGGAITALQMQQGFDHPLEYDPAFWGPEFGFARTLAAAGQSNILIIKASRGGGGNTLWDKAAFDANDDSGHMWGAVRDSVSEALTAAQNAGYQLHVRGLLYEQGESNSVGEAAIADVRLSDLAANIKQYINTNFSNAADNMQTVAAEISNSTSNSTTITTTNRQRQLADSRDDVAFIQTHDQPLKSDNLHFGRDAKLTIGQRFAHAVLDLQSRPASVLARYTADLTAPSAVPHPTTQGWTEDGTAPSGITPNVDLMGVTENGTRGWQINDNSSVNNPGYYQPLTNNDFQTMFDRGWTLRAKVKVVAGEGAAFWSVTAANAPAAWNVSGGAGNIIGFLVDRVDDDQFQVKLVDNQSSQTINLGDGSANDFHTLELVGQAGSNAFDFFVDGQFRFAAAIPNGVGTAGYEDRAMFNSASTGGIGRNVIWNEVSLKLADPIPGDANSDGKVDAADAALMAANWLTVSGATWDMGDFNEDGKVDDADVALLAANWQSGVAGNGSSAPEPTCWALLTVAAISLGLIRR